MSWILPLFPAQPKLGPVYHPLTQFTPPEFPLLLIVPALALDLLWQRTAALGRVAAGAGLRRRVPRRLRRRAVAVRRFPDVARRAQLVLRREILRLLFAAHFLLRALSVLSPRGRRRVLAGTRADPRHRRSSPPGSASPPATGCGASDDDRLARFVAPVSSPRCRSVRARRQSGRLLRRRRRSLPAAGHHPSAASDPRASPKSKSAASPPTSARSTSCPCGSPPRSSSRPCPISRARPRTIRNSSPAPSG